MQKVMKTKENSTLKVLADDGCGGGPCPTLYQDENGRVYIQGYFVNKDISNQVNLDNDETLVEVNEELLRNIVRNLSK